MYYDNENRFLSDNGAQTEQQPDGSRCPRCGESRPDHLTRLGPYGTQCTSCGAVYRSWFAEEEFAYQQRSMQLAVQMLAPTPACFGASLHCPECGERRPGYIVWVTPDTLRCMSCGQECQPWAESE